MPTQESGRPSMRPGLLALETARSGALAGLIAGTVLSAPFLAFTLSLFMYVESYVVRILPGILIGAVTGWIIGLFIGARRSPPSERTAVLTGGGICLAIVTIASLVARSMQMGPLAWIFLIGAPGVLYVPAGGWIGWRACIVRTRPGPSDAWTRRRHLLVFASAHGLLVIALICRDLYWKLAYGRTIRPAIYRFLAVETALAILLVSCGALLRRRMVGDPPPRSVLNAGEEAVLPVMRP